jgi:RNA polymerase sigma-70 factor (ECF subfamily)
LLRAIFATTIAARLMDAEAQDDDDAIFRRWCEGDTTAGRIFVARLLPPVSRFFASKVPAIHDADDLTARTFEVLIDKLREYRGEASPRTFLFGIAHNVLLGWLRDRQRADARFELGSISAASLGPSMTTLLHARRQERLLLDALRAIPMDMQVLLELSYFEDLSRLEISMVMGLPAGTVASRLRRAKELLVVELEKRAESRELATTTATDLEAWARRLRFSLTPGANPKRR